MISKVLELLGWRLERLERCEGCRSRKVEHYDIEGVPLCQKCWDDEPEVESPVGA